MRRSTLPMAVALSALLGLLLAAPSAAATTGTLCGQVTAFTAPTALADGSITIDGTTEVVDSSAFGVIDAATLTVLAAVATADATTCVEITADGAGEIVDLDIAAQAEICGDVTADTATSSYSVGGVLVPAALVAADADLEALLDAAAAANATACIEVTVNQTTGLITTVALDATIDLCGDVSLDADSAAVGGVDVPFAVVDAEGRAVLALAVDAGADACISVLVEDTEIVEANVTASIDLCGEVTLDAEGNATIDGSTIDASLLDADAAALLALAAEADGTACVDVVASSTGGTTSVGVTVRIEVCAEVTAVTDDTITIGDVTFVFAGAAGADIEVGDEACVAATTAPTGTPVITDPDTTDGTAGAGPSTGGSGPLLPDTAVADRAPSEVVAIGAVLLLAAGIAWTARRRVDASA